MLVAQHSFLYYFWALIMELKMKKVFMILTSGIALATLSACSIPTYQKTISTEYNAKGELIGKTVTETITQPSPQSSPMKVKITQDELEK